MLRVDPILGAILPKSIFGRTGFEPISLFEEHKALKDPKSALTVKAKKKKKNPPHPTCSLLVISNKICWQWKTKREEVLVSQHYQDFLAQNVGLGPLSLSSTESQQC